MQRNNNKTLQQDVIKISEATDIRWKDIRRIIEASEGGCTPPYIIERIIRYIRKAPLAVLEQEGQEIPERLFQSSKSCPSYLTTGYRKQGD